MLNISHFVFSIQPQFSIENKLVKAHFLFLYFSSQTDD